ncbi:V-type H+-transporting ATPase subunit E [Angomonas deanei]|nr:V-type H+-transporting ATPase subunit E [Angomonas deanei]|eukprot:EPY37591.1 V-type H+-transporting ATPase subunit E [Angomonas deanei]
MSEARQIQSMIDFIEREAQEKVEELEAAAPGGVRRGEDASGGGREDQDQGQHGKKKKQAEVDRRVGRANYSKEQRMRVMEERAKIMEKLHEETRKRVSAIVANGSAYEKLLKDLLYQSLLSIRSDSVVHVRQEDEKKVSALLGELQRWYKEKTGTEATVSVSKEYLNEDSWGGVVVVSTDGRIVCNNTLSYRTKSSFEEQLPTIRYYLFNAESTI